MVEFSMELFFKNFGREVKQATASGSELGKQSGMHVLHPPQEENFWIHACTLSQFVVSAFNGEIGRYVALAWPPSTGGRA